MSEENTKITKMPATARSDGRRGVLVVIYGATPGRMFEVGEQVLTIGRGADNPIMLDDQEVSRRHATIHYARGEAVLDDLNSTNGTIVNGQAQKQRVLRNGDLVQLGATILKFLDGDNVETQYHEEIYKLTITDGLTGIPNKRRLTEALERETSRAKRYNRPLCALMFDIDHFKAVNDTHGHLAGDAVLRDTAQLVRAHIRAEELFGRWGGEEFLVVLPETHLAGAVTVGEKLRHIVSQSPVVHAGRQIVITVSVGVAAFDAAKTVDQFVEAVDTRLYQAKRDGRNRVCF